METFMISTKNHESLLHEDGRGTLEVCGEQLSLRPVKGKAVFKYQLEPDQPSEEVVLNTLSYDKASHGQCFLAEGSGPSRIQFHLLAPLFERHGQTLEVAYGNETDFHMHWPGYLFVTDVTGLLTVRFLSDTLIEFYFDVKCDVRTPEGKVRRMEINCSRWEVRGDL